MFQLPAKLHLTVAVMRLFSLEEEASYKCASLNYTLRYTHEIARVLCYLLLYYISQKALPWYFSSKARNKSFFPSISPWIAKHTTYLLYHYYVVLAARVGEIPSAWCHCEGCGWCSAEWTFSWDVIDDNVLKYLLLFHSFHAHYVDNEILGCFSVVTYICVCSIVV